MDRPEDAKPMQRFSLKIVLPPSSADTPQTLELTADQPEEA